MGRRVVALGITVLLAGVLTACHGGGHYTFGVNTSADLPDADPGNGVCEATPGSADCTARAAVGEANALIAAAAGTPPKIVVELMTDVTLSRAGTDEDENDTGDLDVKADLTIRGNGFGIDAAGLDRGLHLVTGTLTLVDVTIEGGVVGSPDSRGGGVRTEFGTVLRVVNSTIRNNLAPSTTGCPQASPESCSEPEGGGGIWSDGDITVVGSAFVNNDTPIPACYEEPWPIGSSLICYWTVGGGIAASGALEVVDSTFDNNYARSNMGFGPLGDAIAVSASSPAARVRFSTFVDNGAATDPVFFNGAGSLSASLLVYSACGGLTPSSSGSYNLESACTLPEIGPLADNGGPTQTHALTADSPAVDYILAGTADLCDGSVGVDQRGEPRPAGTDCDVGAYEYQPIAP